MCLGADQVKSYSQIESSAWPTRLEQHFEVLFCRTIKNPGRAPQQVPIEERQRVVIDNVVRPVFIDGP